MDFYRTFWLQICTRTPHLRHHEKTGHWLILHKTLAYVRDIDGLTLYFDFQCFTFPPLVGDENQFWAKITEPPSAEITKPQPGYGFYEEC